MQILNFGTAQDIYFSPMDKYAPAPSLEGTMMRTKQRLFEEWPRRCTYVRVDEWTGILVPWQETLPPNSPILYIYTSIHICAFCVCVFFLWKRWCWWASPALPLPHDRDTASVHIAIGLDLIIRVPGPVCIEDAVTQFLVRSVHNRAPPIQSFSLAVGKDFPFYLCILIFRWLIRDMNTALQGPARAIERIFRREYPRCVYVSIMWSAPAPLHGYLLCVLRSSDSLIYHRKWLWIGSNSVPTPAWWFHRELVKIYRLPN